MQQDGEKKTKATEQVTKVKVTNGVHCLRPVVRGLFLRVDSMGLISFPPSTFFPFGLFAPSSSSPL